MGMDRSEILSTVSEHLASVLELDRGEIGESSNLYEDLGVDSLDLLELILVIKEQFGIKINDGEVKLLLAELAQFLPDQKWGSDLSDEELAQVARSLTIGTIISFIESRMGA